MSEHSPESCIPGCYYYVKTREGGTELALGESCVQGRIIWSLFGAGNDESGYHNEVVEIISGPYTDEQIRAIPDLLKACKAAEAYLSSWHLGSDCGCELHAILRDAVLKAEHQS